MTFQSYLNIPFDQFWKTNSLNNIIPKFIIPWCIDGKELKINVWEKILSSNNYKVHVKDYLLWILKPVNWKWIYDSKLFTSSNVWNWFDLQNQKINIENKYKN